MVDCLRSVIKHSAPQRLVLGWQSLDSSTTFHTRIPLPFSGLFSLWNVAPLQTLESIYKRQTATKKQAEKLLIFVYRIILQQKCCPLQSFSLSQVTCGWSPSPSSTSNAYIRILTPLKKVKKFKTDFFQWIHHWTLRVEVLVNASLKICKSWRFVYYGIFSLLPKYCSGEKNCIFRFLVSNLNVELFCVFFVSLFLTKNI